MSSSNSSLEMIKVSVIIPIYNTAPWLGDCLESVLSQDHANLQIICVDDGSTDGSAQILETYAFRDERIIVIRQENRGLLDARNRGMQQANGKYLMFLDSDDIMAKGIITKALHQAEADCLEFLCFRYEIIYDEGWKGKRSEKKLSQPDYPGKWTGPDLYSAEKLNRDYHTAVWSSFYLRDFLCTHSLEFRFFPFEDTLFTYECYLCAKRVGFLNEIGLSYRKREGSISTLPHDINYVRSRYLTSRTMELLCYEKQQILPELPAPFYKEIQVIIKKALANYQKHPKLIRSQAEGKSDQMMLEELDRFLKLDALQKKGKRLQKELTEKEKTIIRIQKEMAQKENLISQIQSELEAVYSSESWKLGTILTYPFHWLRKIVRHK